MPDLPKPPPGPDKTPPKPDGSTFWDYFRRMGWYPPLLLLIVILWMWQSTLPAMLTKTIDYSVFEDYLAKGEVDECKIEDVDIVGKITPKPPAKETAPAKAQEKPQTKGAVPAAEKGKEPAKPAADKAKEPAKPAEKTATPKASEEPSGPFQFRTTYGGDETLRLLLPQLKAAKVKYSFVKPSPLTQFVLVWLLPLAIFGGLWFFLSRGLRNAGQSVMSFGQSRARVVADRDTGVTFDDVAGCDEAKYELQEVVDFLKNPTRYTALGAKIPKGVLLVGLPGTGQDAALAAPWPARPASPSSPSAAANSWRCSWAWGPPGSATCSSRPSHRPPASSSSTNWTPSAASGACTSAPVNDEREQTLNQLLVEMDGFQANVGVILLAATNRPEILDRALLRPGRFDRQVVIDAPDMEGREAILKVHGRGKPLADERRPAQDRPGDARLFRRRPGQRRQRGGPDGRPPQGRGDHPEGPGGGRRKGGGRPGAEEPPPGRGRASAAWPITKSAMPWSPPTASMPTRCTRSASFPAAAPPWATPCNCPRTTSSCSRDPSCRTASSGMLGGRAAEEVVFNEVSTGAENDLEHATTLARTWFACTAWATRSDWSIAGSGPIPSSAGRCDGATRRDCSPETADQIDREVKRLLDTAYQEAKAILLEHRQQLETVAAALFERETLDRAGLLELLGLPAPAAAK